MEVHHLDAENADALWQWLLHRQGLHSDRRFTSASAVAAATLGLHAARLPSPFATVLARATQPAVALSLWDDRTHRELVTLRCMRKTLHTMPVALAGAAHSATLHYRQRDALRQLTNAGVSDRLVTALIARIKSLLAERSHLTHRQIEERLAQAGTPVPAARLALKLAWECGELTYRNRSGGWNREHRTFALTATSHPDLHLSLDRDTATTRLIEAYFDRYGPASLRDATWWSGLSRTAVVTALDQAGRPLTAVSTPWADSTLYLPRARFEEFTRQRNEQSPAQVHFLAHEDVALKAYAETRKRYLGALDEDSAFNQIGEALPAIVINGRVTGSWSWDVPTRAVRCRLHRTPAEGADRTAVRAAARQLTVALRAGYAEIRANRPAPHGLAELLPSPSP